MCVRAFPRKVCFSDRIFFFVKQVIGDPRVRLEARLREAGVMQSDYARHVMSKMKPIHPPRRDMESTVFK